MKFGTESGDFGDGLIFPLFLKCPKQKMSPKGEKGENYGLKIDLWKNGNREK